MKARHPLARPLWHQQALAGFTLLESVIALLLLAIVAAYAVPKAFNAGALTLDAQARTLASHVQRAQLLASTSGQTVYVCALGNAYLIQVGPYLPGQPCPLSPPGQTTSTQPVVVTLAQQTTVTAMPNPLAFDTRGQPGSAGSFQLQTALDAHTITVSAAALTGLISLASP
jgi:prepilin-type N-terminal cleavage/methylation domain-containing protein